MENLVERKIIVDGLLENCIDYPVNIQIGNENFGIDIKSISNNELSLIDNSIKTQILQKISYKKSKIFETIQNVDGLPIYFEIIKDTSMKIWYIVLIAFGEIQPARYRIFLEGVFIYPNSLLTLNPSKPHNT